MLTGCHPGGCSTFDWFWQSLLSMLDAIIFEMLEWYLKG